jgi:hypothetical protein
MLMLEKINYNCEQMPLKKNDNEMFLFLKQKNRAQGKDNRVSEDEVRAEGTKGTTVKQLK